MFIWYSRLLRQCSDKIIDQYVYVLNMLISLLSTKNSLTSCKEIIRPNQWVHRRDVYTGATGKTAVAPLTLSQFGPSLTPVIIYKSHRELSPIEQYTIFLAKKKFKKSLKKNTCSFLMQTLQFFFQN